VSRKHLILCGGSRLQSNADAWRNVDTIPLSAAGSDPNVTLRISDITERMVASLPPIAADLVELATYVYCADQATRRGGTADVDYGESWRRHFNFVIPVRVPDVWCSPAVSEALRTTLGFLSDDDYEFSFTTSRKHAQFSEYLELDPQRTAVKDVQEVVLFSGGIDSLGGAVQEALVEQKKVALVSHRSNPKTYSRQQRLVGLLTERVKSPEKRPFHVPVSVHKDEDLGREYTQRTRSFLYASIACVVAKMFGLFSIRFYENGVISFNFPLCDQITGARATRTTHPQTISGYSNLFSLLFDQAFKVEHPFLWKTKTDVMLGLKAAGQADLCSHAVSCTRTWHATRIHRHCGRCSQCVDRRLAALAAGMDEDDPREGYESDVLIGARESVEDATLVERLLATLNEIERMRSPTEFTLRFPELSRVLRYLPGSAKDAAQRVFELHQRHARQLNSAIDEHCKPLLPELRRGDLPHNCLAALAVRGGTNAVSSPVSYVPTKEDVQLLEALDRFGRAATGIELERVVRLSRKTIGKRLHLMQPCRFIYYPAGPKKGAAIGKAGEAWLKERDAKQRVAPATQGASASTAKPDLAQPATYPGRAAKRRPF